MSFALDETELEILETARRVAAGLTPLTIDGVVDVRRAYREFAELGFFGLNALEEQGGLALGEFPVGLVAYGFGRELVPGPWLEQLVAVAAATELGAGSVVERLVAGELLVGECLTRSTPAGEQTSRGATTPTALRVAGGVDGWLLKVAGDEGLTVVLVERGVAGSSVRPERTVDLRWSAESLELADADCEALGPLDPAAARRLQRLASALTAATAIGASERLLDLTTAYARDREQFGRPIGSFQAVKHRLAELYIEIEHARNLVFAALAASTDDERERLTPMAAVLAAETYRGAAEAGVHLHGGIGFTWECPVHLFLKNALRLRAYPVPLEAHRRAIRSRLELTPTSDREVA